MQARMKNPLMVLPGALDGLMAVGKAASPEGLPYVLIKLVHLRASQINGCGVCTDMHARELKKAGEQDKRLHTVAAWRETPWFTDAERAALALTEAVTRVADRGDAVSDEIWADAARHFDETELAALVMQIALINTFNRINAATRQMAGAWG
ncbi:MAG: carboxymuconolactone decarboxylase family protein [Burkholderiales bacterium]|nr:MAG: carboxymuconolactone decarboxylase family protein [Burkholderiales bacterium]